MPKPRLEISPRHREVVDNYFGVSNFDKTDAIRRAGYAHPNKNCGIFSRPAVKAEVERRHEAMKEKYELTYERIMDELMRIAYSSPLDFGEPGSDGYYELDLTKATPDQMRAIGEIHVKKYVNKRGEPGTDITIRPWNKLTALEALIRHAGLSREKSPFEGAGDLVERILAARNRVRAEEKEE